LSLRCINSSALPWPSLQTTAETERRIAVGSVA